MLRFRQLLVIIFSCDIKNDNFIKMLAICQYDVNWDICHYYFTYVLELEALQNKMLKHYKNVKCRLQASNAKE